VHRQISEGPEKVTIFANWIAGALRVTAGGKPALNSESLLYLDFVSFACLIHQKKQILKDDEQKFTNHQCAKPLSLIIPLLI
jgi:hypothetical protein